MQNLSPSKYCLHILDDEPESMKKVLCYALTRDKYVYDDDVIDALGNCVHLYKSNYVGAAVTAIQTNKPDLVFVDLKIVSPEETDPEILRYPYQGFYLIYWLRNRFGHSLPIKVHSQLAETDEVQQLMADAGVNIPDYFEMGRDYIPTREKLKRNFPVILKNLAKNHLKSRIVTAFDRLKIRETLEIKYRDGIENEPVDILGGFSLRTLLVGWLKIRLNSNGSVETVWDRPFAEILDDLFLEDGFDDKKPLNSKIKWVKDLLEGFSEGLSTEDIEKIQEEATQAVREFSQKWGNKVPVEKLLQDIPALKLNSVGVADTTYNIEDIFKSFQGEEHQCAVCTKTIRLRLVVGGVWAIRDHFCPKIKSEIVDYAILACIRNNLMDVRSHFTNPDSKKSQVKKYLSALGLGKEKVGYGKDQTLKTDYFFPFEKDWLDGLPDKI